MTNDYMRRLQHSDDEAFARRLLDALPSMRSSFGGFSKTTETFARRPFVRIDQAQGRADAGSDLGSCESAGVTS